MRVVEDGIFRSAACAPYWGMTKTIHLFQAQDAQEGYAIRLAEDPPEGWRWRRGYGSEFTPVWTVELESEAAPSADQVDWEAVLDRALEAYQLSDPIIYNYRWPVLA